MKPPIVIFGDNLLTALVVLSQIIFVVILFVYIKDRKNTKSEAYVFIEKNALLLAFLVALTATLGSLFYSEIAHYEPCKFCWFQRIAIYPQALLLGIALWKKDLKIWIYSLPLSIIGAVIAGNHYLLQISGSSIFPCSAVGQSVSCSKVFVTHLNYITIPLMAFSACGVMLVSILFVRKQELRERAQNETTR